MLHLVMGVEIKFVDSGPLKEAAEDAQVSLGIKLILVGVVSRGNEGNSFLGVDRI